MSTRPKYVTMPRLNPNRVIIEDYYRMPIRELFWNSSGIPGQVTEQVHGPVCLKIWTTPDDNGWIEFGDRRWRVQYHPRSQWNNTKYQEYCADYWVIGRNGKRHNYLLIAPDGSHCATRSELTAHYRSSHVFSPHRILKRRREILDELELTNIDASGLNLHFVPSLNNPTGVHWKTGERRQQRLLGHDFVLVRRPKGKRPGTHMRTARFKKLLAYLNKPHRGKGDGKDRIAEIDRLFA
jgi:hypothetical protein